MKEINITIIKPQNLRSESDVKYHHNSWGKMMYIKNR